MRLMEDAVADGIGDTRFADRGMPRRRRELTGDERGAAFTAIFDFEEVTAIPNRTPRTPASILSGASPDHW